MARRTTDRQFPSVRAVSRYDVVLAVIPAAFLLALLAAVLLSTSLRTALTAGSTIGALAVFDALFRNPPRSGVRST